MSGSLEPDTSMYQTIQAPPRPEAAQSAANPFAMLQAIQGLQKGSQDIQQQGMQMRAQQAIGRAVQGATDPTTGQVDEDKAASAVAADPDAAYMANDFRSAQIARKLQSAQIPLDQIETSLKQHQMTSAKLSQLYDDPAFDPQTGSSKDAMAKLHDAAGDLVSQGIISAKQAVNELQGFNENMPVGQIKQKLGALISTSEIGANALRMLHPDVTPFNDGTKIQFAQTSPLANPNAANGMNIPLAAPISQQAAPGPTTTDGMGNPVSQTGKEFMQKGGIPTNSPGVVYGGGPSGPNPLTGKGINSLPPEGQGQATAPQGAATPPGPLSSAAVGKPATQFATPSGFTPKYEAPIVPPGQSVQEWGAPAIKEAELRQNTWNANSQALAQTLGHEQQLSQITQLEQEAMAKIKMGAGTEGLQQLARAGQTLANYVGKTAGDQLREAANGLLKKNGTDTGDALAAAQAYQQLIFRQTSEFVQSSFAHEGTEGVFNQALESANTASKEPGSLIAQANLIRQTYDYHQKQAQAAEAWKNANGINSQWQNFNNAWLERATEKGFGSTTPIPNAALQMPGDQKGLDGEPKAGPRMPKTGEIHKQGNSYYTIGSDGWGRKVPALGGY